MEAHPIGMDLTLVRRLMHHENLKRWMKQVQESRQKTLITVQHDTERIHQIMKRVKSDGEHYWWDVFTGYSPSATKILNILTHPILILLIIMTILTTVNLIFWCKLKKLTEQIWTLQTVIKYNETLLTAKEFA